MPRLVRGVNEARRAAAAAADPRLACCLLWLAAPSLRLSWSDDTLAALLRFCDAALSSCGDTEELSAEDGDGISRPGAAVGPGGDWTTAEQRQTIAEEGRQIAEQERGRQELEREAAADSAPMEDEEAEARAELSARLDATALFVARHCGDGVARFVHCPGRRREAALLLATLDRAEPELARRLRLSPPADSGTHQL